jgi:outer membrane protein TolC
LTATRFDFGPQLAATVSSLWGKTEDGPSVLTHGASASASQILSTGGVLAVDGGLSRFRTSGDRGYASDAGVSLSQPLLQGAGYEVSHEALTQAERDLVYAVRSFELFRQDFVIGIARDYFDLVRQARQLANDEQNYRDAVFDREKAEALRQVDRNQDEDVFIARRREINAQTDLLSARADLELAQDSFRIRLGLPEGTRVAVEDVEPPFAPVRLDADSAAAVALHNRLDLLTAAERLEDDERAVRIARNGLLPRVDLDLDWRFTDEGRHLGQAWPSDWAASAGLTVEVPLQRTPERNSYVSALIALERNRRDHELLLENTERDIRDSLRQLSRTEQQALLQRQQIDQERRAVAVTQIRFEAGEADARDLLDARQSLLDAENRLIDLEVEHFIGRLQLYRDLGLLFVDEQGGWET